MPASKKQKESKINDLEDLRTEFKRLRGTQNTKLVTKYDKDQSKVQYYIVIAILEDD